MKKLISAVLALAMLMSLTACGGNTATEPATEPAASVEMSCEEVLNKIVEANPVEFMGGTMPVDLTDTSEDGLWSIKYFTGLDNAQNITEACVFEPMMGSIAFSMVMVRVAPGAGEKSVAEAMKAGIDTRKWICVEANDAVLRGCLPECGWRRAELCYLMIEKWQRPPAAAIFVKGRFLSF